jgi:hypothetical protein
MGLQDWNWKLPVEIQDVPWDCAAASLTWALNAVGYPQTEADVVAGLGPSRISPAQGLLDASGAGLVEYLNELGLTAFNDADASFQEVMDAAGYQPMVIGGRQWCHWTAVRIGSGVFGASVPQALALANPAPGWMGVDQILEAFTFAELGPFSAVWFTGW